MVLQKRIKELRPRQQGLLSKPPLPKKRPAFRLDKSKHVPTSEALTTPAKCVSSPIAVFYPVVQNMGCLGKESFFQHLRYHLAVSLFFWN